MSWYQNWESLSPNDQFILLKEKLCNIQTIGEYEGKDDTPFDLFDSVYHKDMNLGLMNEEELIFMINTSEHLKRPSDMLMFLGEYFKEHIKKTEKIKNSII
jgi:hypothetical protein